MKKYVGLLGLFFLVLLSACGYQLQGMHTPALNSVLGDGSRTLRIEKVEQSSMNTWLPYFARSAMYDEIHLRKIARWQDDGPTDYSMVIRIPSFQTDSYISNDAGETLLSVATMRLEVIVYDTSDRHVVWQSGVVSYSERYERLQESWVIKEIMTQIIREAVDRMQQNF